MKYKKYKDELSDNLIDGKDLIGLYMFPKNDYVDVIFSGTWECCVKEQKENYPNQMEYLISHKDEYPFEDDDYVHLVEMKNSWLQYGTDENVSREGTMDVILQKKIESEDHLQSRMFVCDGPFQECCEAFEIWEVDQPGENNG